MVAQLVSTAVYQQDLNLKYRQKLLGFDTDVYLKREIELLELEKKRLALQLSIKEYKDKQKDKNNQEME